MPELPEVETVVRSLRPHIEGRYLNLARVWRTPCLQEGSQSLKSVLGARVSSVWRRGKLICIDLDAGCGALVHAVVHLRMTGSLFALDNRDVREEKDLEPFATKHTRFLAGFAGSPQNAADCVLRFDDVRTFGRIFLADDRKLAAWPYWATLGPEPLEMSEPLFASRLLGRRAIKSVLLDQKTVAGIGNIYADETLCAACVHPETPANLLQKDDIHRLYVHLRRILELAIRECGSSIRNYSDANGNVGAFQNHFAAYGKAGEPCERCGSKLRRILIGGRSSVFCPHCQRKAGKARN